MSDPLASLGTAAGVDTPAIRRAGPDLLSLALLDTRNRSLQLLSGWEDLAGQRLEGVRDHPLWLIGHAAWAQEAWVARNVQRHRGLRADFTQPRLASIDPDADRWFDPGVATQGVRSGPDLPGPDAIRQYLGDTLEVTLALLADTPQTEDALHVFRLALFHEDLLRQEVLHLAQAADRPVAPTLQVPAPRRPLPALTLPRTNWTLGDAGQEAEEAGGGGAGGGDTSPGGFVFDHDRGTQTVELPAFEIDTQPVSWAQYVEFINDDGYDDPQWWSPAGGAWLSSLHEPRRAPGRVLQIAGGVVQLRFGRACRVAMHEPVSHVSWHEAQAWCRWAGRQLPTQAHWEAAALGGHVRGFQWGDVLEWVSDAFVPYGGFEPDLWGTPVFSPVDDARVVRGASWATPGRLRWARRREARSPADDHAIIGFRTCAIIGG